MSTEMTAAGLLGRSAELDVLSGLIARAPEQGDAIVLVGEAGIGKSSLLRATAADARGRGFEVLEVTGMEVEAQLPFAGLHQLLRPVLDHADRLPPVQRRALLSAFGVEEGPPPDAFLIALSVLNLLAEVATGRPVAVLVDDVQWLDRPSHEGLAFVARRVGSDPIVIVGGIRKGHTGPLTAMGLRELNLGGLDDSAARRLLDVTATGLSAADRIRILRQADGNPLALVELPSALCSASTSAVESVPAHLPLNARLEKAFVGRLTELPRLTRDVLLIAAVDYENTLPEILAAASAMAGRPVPVDALDAAAAAGLIRLDETSVVFRHPLVRSGVLQTEPVQRRLAANAALAEVLTDQPYRRTWHRAQAVVGPDDEVADELEENHVISVRRGSVTAAISALERSAQLTGDSSVRGRRLLLAAEYAFELGRADLVDRLLGVAARNALSALDRARMEWLREIFDDGVPGDASRVLELCDIARRSARAGDNDLALNLLLGAALRCWWADTGPAARARVVAMAERLDGVGHDPRLIATLAVAEPVLRSTRVAELLSHPAMATVTAPDSLRLLGMAAHAIGSPVLSLEFLDRAETKLREQGRLGLLSHVLTMGLVDRLELGEWDRVVSAAEEGSHLARETGQLIWDTGTLSLRAITAAVHGDNEQAQRLAGQAEETAGGRRLNNLLACVQLARGIGWLSAGQPARAYDELRRLFDPRDPCFHATERFHGVMFLAEAAARAERCADAAAVVAGLEEEAAVTPSTTLHVQLSYARAVLAEDDVAEASYTTALAQDLIRWPWAKARIELAYGMWLRRQRRVAESRVPLRSALTTFDLIGARTWGDQARTELRAAGERTASRERSAGIVLSPQELQIARLAADGLSNREIGERLYLSPRTVASHLYRIFPKLDITARSQLAARLNTV